MSLHVIVGAGPVGAAIARQLADRDEQVRIITRRGGGPEGVPGIERVAADATDMARLSELAAGAIALYNCANPQYHQWLTDWPPLASALLTAAERSGAVLATACNLYGYGPVNGPITEARPLAATHPKLRIRADMWRDALAAHQAHRIRATEVRGSDYIEANSIFSLVLTKPLLAGKRAYVPAALDAPHSWTSVYDVARTLVTVATDERTHFRRWGSPVPRSCAPRLRLSWGMQAGRMLRAPNATPVSDTSRDPCHSRLIPSTDIPCRNHCHCHVASHFRIQIRSAAEDGGHSRGAAMGRRDVHEPVGWCRGKAAVMTTCLPCTAIVGLHGR